MRLMLAAVAMAMLLALLPMLAFAQNEQAFDVIKAKGSESFAFHNDASNHDSKNPVVYNFDGPKAPSWILTIHNNQSYVDREGARTVIKIREPAPSEKFIEIMMYGSNDSNKYLVSVNTPETGYQRMYDSDLGGWSPDGPISVGHDLNQGLSVTDGKRIVIDRLDLNGFAVGSIAVYGNDGGDNSTSLANTDSGDISFELFYGDFQESQLYFVPAAVMAGVGGLVIGLLILKKRKPSD
jgi:hypothetical protein